MVTKRPRIVIVGAGMAGLTAAHRLRTVAGDLIDLTVLEAGDRLGGRILSSCFAGDRIEMGATWIHGIDGSPVHAIAADIGALSAADSVPYERMDGFPVDPVTVAEGGGVVEPSVVDSVSLFYKSLMDSAREGKVPVTADNNSVGSFLRSGKGALAADGSGDWTLDAVFAVSENTERTYTSADDLDDLDLAAESEYKEFGGDQITIADGYSRVIEHLASALPEGSIRMNAKVREIEWCRVDGGEGPVRVHVDGGGREGEEVVVADHVIVTVSLGVLKAGLRKDADAGSVMRFSPGLPGFKREAIGRLGFGVVDKLFMEMDGGDEFPYLQLAFKSEGHVEKIPRWMRRTASICPIYGGSRVVLAWLAGEEAAEMEELEDGDVIGGVHATLEAFRVGRRVLRVRRSGWRRNPLFLGSYSYVALGSSGEDLDLMAEPLPRGGETTMQLLFAGEATHRTHYSTTHGAYFSGKREANRLLQYYRCCSGNNNNTSNGCC
ncbi:putative polyamine oxidase 5 [Iris pallida]|uniref:Polyamine oxidase 5 n=1 Tax=Iris pallida TaxID=29817 RepID=A0AAX6FVR9_IRIPA|nr:putative polyamine oxidase 5 [Iris pallida]